MTTYISDYLNQYYVDDDYAESISGEYVQHGMSIDWGAKVIHVPKSILQLVQTTPTTIYDLSIDEFRKALKELESDEIGISFDHTHNNQAPVTIGGVTLARVVEITNDYTVTFEDGQYAINLVGANSNIADVTNVNQVSVRSANSAGLTYSKQMEDQSYLDGRVWIDTVYGKSGSSYPRGTPSDPVNNYEDAEHIAEDRNLPYRFWLNGVLYLYDEGYESESHIYDWLGASPVNANIVLLGHTTEGSIFRRVGVTGMMNGNCSFQDSVIQNITNWESDASVTGIGGTVTLGPGASTQLVTFHQCFSIVPGTGSPVLDCNNIPNLNVQFRGYDGGIHIKNFTDPNSAMTIDLNSGHAKLDSSCTAGTIVVRGAGRLTDNSNGTLVVDNVAPVWSRAEKDATITALGSIADAVTLLQKYEENKSVIDKVNNTLTIYDDDGVTPILVFSLRNSVGTPSTDEVAQRVPQ